MGAFSSFPMGRTLLSGHLEDRTGILSKPRSVKTMGIRASICFWVDVARLQDNLESLLSLNRGFYQFFFVVRD